MNFGLAIEAMKNGNKLSRKDWNETFIVYMSGMTLPPYDTQGTNRKVNDRTAKWIGEDQPLNSQPYLAMYNDKKEWCPGWIPSQSDVLSCDWYVIK